MTIPETSGSASPPGELYEEIRPQAFSFGQNWRRFLEHLTPAQIDAAQQSLVNFLGRDSLAGMTFCDLGCGSGLFSLAARRLGAKVCSVDVDPDSVACAMELRRREGAPPEEWQIVTASALDASALAGLGQFQIVYSWGVLHHTGAMWDALRNMARLVAPGGLCYLAIYNEHHGFPSSALWRKIKRVYAHGGPVFRKLLETGYFTAFFGALLLRGRNPWRYVRTYSARSQRGMGFYRDAVDWLGGYPYEYATPEVIEEFARGLGWNVLRTQRVTSIGCNEFLFQRPERSGW